MPLAKIIWPRYSEDLGQKYTSFDLSNIDLSSTISTQFSNVRDEISHFYYKLRCHQKIQGHNVKAEAITSHL